MAFLNPLAPGSSPGWPTRNGTSPPIRRTMRPRWLRCRLTHMSALRGLLATETTSHDASKPICHFCPCLKPIGWLIGLGVHFGVQNSGSASDRAACSSGVATCAYARFFPDSEVVGLDIEHASLNCGQQLARTLRLQNVRFVQGDLLAPFSTDVEAYDLVVASCLSSPYRTRHSIRGSKS